MSNEIKTRIYKADKKNILIVYGKPIPDGEMVYFRNTPGAPESNNGLVQISLRQDFAEWSFCSYQFLMENSEPVDLPADKYGFSKMSTVDILAHIQAVNYFINFTGQDWGGCWASIKPAQEELCRRIFSDFFTENASQK